MKGNKTTVFIAALSTLAFFSNAFASEESKTPKHVIVDSRPLSQEKRELMNQKRQAELEEALSGTIVPIKQSYAAITAPETKQSTAAAYSPYLYHWLDHFPQDNVVKLEDGSEWMFDGEQIGIMRTWRPGDTIVISPQEPGWFWGSSVPYILKNKDLGTTVEVHPFVGPTEFGQYSMWVVGLDFDRNLVYLVNGQGDRTIWEISGSESYLFHDWAVNDHIMIAESTSWYAWWYSYDTIINVNMNHSVNGRPQSTLPSPAKQNRSAS